MSLELYWNCTISLKDFIAFDDGGGEQCQICYSKISYRFQLGSDLVPVKAIEHDVL